MACLTAFGEEDEVVATDVEGYTRLVRERLSIHHFSRRDLEVSLILALSLSLFLTYIYVASASPPQRSGSFLGLRQARPRSRFTVTFPTDRDAETRILIAELTGELRHELLKELANLVCWQVNSLLPYPAPSSLFARLGGSHCVVPRTISPLDLLLL